MKLTLTNTGAVAVPITSTDGGGWSVTLDPNGSQVIDRPDSDVWLIGDKPGHLENIAKGFQTIVDALTFFRRARGRAGAAAAISIVAVNNGERGVRIVPGNVEGESTLEPGAEAAIDAAEYIELRELSGKNPVENPPPGSYSN